MDMQIQAFDSNKAPIAVSYKGMRSHGSKTGGVCSIALILTMLIISAYKLYQLLVQKYPKISSYQITESSPLNITPANIFIRIRDFSDPYDWQHFVGSQQQFSYGINVTIEAIDEHRDTVEQRMLVPCNISGYEYSFKYFCIPSDMKLEVKGRDDKFRQRRSQGQQNLMKYLIRIKPCGRAVSQACKILDTDLQVNIVFNHSPIKYSQNSSNIQFDTQTKQLYAHTFLSQQLAYIHNIYFKSIEVATDTSILPTALTSHQEYQQSIYSDDDDNKIEVIERYPDDEYCVYIIMRGTTTLRYFRSFPKIDFVLAEILGLTSTISFVAYLTYRGYNQWKFQRQEAINQGNVDLPKPSIIVYYRQKLSSLCKKNNNRSFPRLDIYAMAKRIEILESKLESITEKLKISNPNESMVINNSEKNLLTYQQRKKQSLNQQLLND